MELLFKKNFIQHIFGQYGKGVNAAYVNFNRWIFFLTE